MAEREETKVLDEKFDELVKYCMVSGEINPNLYVEYDVKRGLRDSNGKGVLVGLTEISNVVAYDIIDGRKLPCDGRLEFQGYNVQDLINDFAHRKYGFEETTYLLLFGALPNKEQRDSFLQILSECRHLPDGFVRDVIMNTPTSDMMNALQRAVLSLYSYDEHADDISIPNVLRQSLNLIAKFPLIAGYAYQAYKHYFKERSLVIRYPKEDLSTAENLLRILRTDAEYTELEAKVLDVALILHSEHGGGNNSTFTNHVVTSSHTDTYSAVAASLGSLKGPRHGGANLKVENMFEDIKEHVKDPENETEVRNYITKILDKEAFDHSGLVYGMGHAVYTKSDPRCVILKDYAKQLSKEKGREEDFALHETVEKVSAGMIMERKQLQKPVCANVDFYSGFVYNMLRIPKELYTPIFAMARISGWSAHRMEELVNRGKIIRPAYLNVGKSRPYVPLEERK
ncbi:MAG: citrate/2-methylcitrate synthase [Lachnospiraceae bacterium]|nr:citrate/2-methylcitrate synthase [Lachnospiraceae bacterium]